MPRKSKLHLFSLRATECNDMYCSFARKGQQFKVKQFAGKVHYKKEGITILLVMILTCYYFKTTLVDIGVLLRSACKEDRLQIVVAFPIRSNFKDNI